MAVVIDEALIRFLFFLSLSLCSYSKLKKVSPLFQTIGTKPIAHIDHFTAEMLGTAELVEEVNLDGSGKLVKVRIRRSVCTEITAALSDASHLS